MSIKRISVILVVTIVSNTVRCTPTLDVVPDTPKPKTPFSTTLPASSAHTSLSDELLDVLKNFHSSLPTAGQKTSSATETAPISPPLVNDRITVMHFPAAPALGSNNGATPHALVPGVIHERLPFGLDMHTPDRGNKQLAEPLLQSRGPAGNPLPVSVPPPTSETSPSSAPAPGQQSSPIAISPASSRSSDPALTKLEPVALPHNFGQELTKLLTDLRMTPTSLQAQTAAVGQNQMIPDGPTTHPAETLPLLSPSSPASLQPSKVTRPILGPNQTPLDYLLSSSSPIHKFNPLPDHSTLLITNGNDQPQNAKPRPNLEFVKYLLTLPRYQDALNELIKAQSSIQS